MNTNHRVFMERLAAHFEAFEGVESVAVMRGLVYALTIAKHHPEYIAALCEMEGFQHLVASDNGKDYAEFFPLA